jgi:hypothetical protein
MSNCWTSNNPFHFDHPRKEPTPFEVGSFFTSAPESIPISGRPNGHRV